MKYFAVCAFFPQAASHAAHQGPVTVRTSNIRLAAKHGLDRLMDAQGVKGKQIQTCKVEIQFIRKGRRSNMAGRKTPKQRHALPLRFSLDSKEAAEQRYQVDQAFILSGERFLNDFLLDVVMKAARKRLASLSAADLEDLRKKGRPYKG